MRTFRFATLLGASCALAVATAPAGRADTVLTVRPDGSVEQVEVGPRPDAQAPATAQVGANGIPVRTQPYPYPTVVRPPRRALRDSRRWHGDHDSDVIIIGDNTKVYVDNDPAAGGYYPGYPGYYTGYPGYPYPGYGVGYPYPYPYPYPGYAPGVTVGGSPGIEPRYPASPPRSAPPYNPDPPVVVYPPGYGYGGYGAYGAAGARRSTTLSVGGGKSRVTVNRRR